MNLIELQRALRQLWLGGMATVLETRLRQAQSEDMASIDLMSCLVSDELNRRSERLLERPRRRPRQAEQVFVVRPNSPVQNGVGGIRGVARVGGRDRRDVVEECAEALVRRDLEPVPPAAGGVLAGRRGPAERRHAVRPERQGPTTDVEPGQYRFRVLVGKSVEFCGEVRALGDKLLSVIEKHDAEGLSLLRSVNEINDD